MDPDRPERDSNETSCLPETLQEYASQRGDIVLPALPPVLPFKADHAAAVLYRKKRKQDTSFEADLTTSMHASLHVKKRPKVLGKEGYSDTGFFGAWTSEVQSKPKHAPSRKRARTVPEQSPQPASWTPEERRRNLMLMKSVLTQEEHDKARQLGPRFFTNEETKSAGASLRMENDKFINYTANLATVCNLCKRTKTKHNHMNELFLLSPVLDFYNRQNELKWGGHLKPGSTPKECQHIPHIPFDNEKGRRYPHEVIGVEQLQAYGEVGRVYLAVPPAVATNGGVSRQVDCRLGVEEREQMSLAGIRSHLFFPARGGTGESDQFITQETAPVEQPIRRRESTHTEAEPGYRRKPTVQQNSFVHSEAGVTDAQDTLRAGLFSPEKVLGVPLVKDGLIAAGLKKVLREVEGVEVVAALTPAVLAKLTHRPAAQSTVNIPIVARKEGNTIVLTFGKSFKTGWVRPKEVNQKFFKRGVINDVLLGKHREERGKPRPSEEEGAWQNFSMSINGAENPELSDFDPTAISSEPSETKFPSDDHPYEHYSYSRAGFSSKSAKKNRIQLVLRSKTHAKREDTNEPIFVHAHMEYCCKPELV